MGTKVRYVGPHESVRIPDGQVVQQNHQVEVSAELAKSLLEQESWEKADAKGGK